MKNQNSIPCQKDLDKLFAVSHSIALRKEQIVNGYITGHETVKHWSQANEMDSIREMLTLSPNQDAQTIFAVGDYQFSFFDEDDKLISNIDYIGFGVIRCRQLWDYDVKLIDENILDKWLIQIQNPIPPF